MTGHTSVPPERPIPVTAWLAIRMAFLAARYAPDRLLYRLQQAMNDPHSNMRNAARIARADAELFAQDPPSGQRGSSRVCLRPTARASMAQFTNDGSTSSCGGSNSKPPRSRPRSGTARRPPNMGEHRHSRIPASRLIVLPGEAHLSLIHRHARGIVNDLIADHVAEQRRRG